MKKSDRFLVETYGYIENLINFFLEFLPPQVRMLYYRLVFAQMGKNVFIGEKCYFKYPWKIRIGSNVSIGMGCQFFPSYQYKDAFIIIEDGVMTGPNLVIYGAGHPSTNPAELHIADTVTLKQNCYIGGNVVIHYGIEVGRESIVGMGSVVTKTVPARSIMSGNPARIVGRRE